MAEPRATPPAMLLVAVFSHYPAALNWVKRRVELECGTVGLVSPIFEHSETSYYKEDMGCPLVKQFLVVDNIWDPAELATLKLRSNAWERELADSGTFLEKRPVNIDPGYLMLNKLILASAKDRAHRIYLRDGVYAEECLYYVGGWQSRPWTYPDYQRADFQVFFTQIRERLKHLIACSL